MGRFTTAALLLTILATASVEGRTRKQFSRLAHNATIIVPANNRIFYPQQPGSSDGPTCIIVRNRRSYVERKTQDEGGLRQVTPTTPTTPTIPPPGPIPTPPSPSPPAPINCIITDRPDPPPSLFGKPWRRSQSETATPIRSSLVMQRRRKNSQETRRKLTKQFNAQKPYNSRPSADYET